jgi:hypothetical protein
MEIRAKGLRGVDFVARLVQLQAYMSSPEQTPDKKNHKRGSNKSWLGHRVCFVKPGSSEPRAIIGEVGCEVTSGAAW